MTMTENDIRMRVPDSLFRLMRAMRRRPPRPVGQFPPAVERLLISLSENEGVSSRNLCEIMDLRPSSMSELMTRMEEEGLLRREGDENDRRVQRVYMTDAGREAAERGSRARSEDAERMTACFTGEEASRFCELCDKLASHLEKIQDPRIPVHIMPSGEPRGPVRVPPMEGFGPGPFDPDMPPRPGFPPRPPRGPRPHRPPCGAPRGPVDPHDGPRPPFDDENGPFHGSGGGFPPVPDDDIRRV